MSILRGLSTAATDHVVIEIWKSYRSHTHKNVQWLLPQLVKLGARKLEDMRPLFGKEAVHPFVLDQLKQLGFYTDCLGKRHWSIPKEAIGEECARYYVETAKILASKKVVSVQEIELWILHVGSLPKDDLPQLKQGVARWYSAMQEAGLYPRGINQMEKFLNEGVS